MRIALFFCKKIPFLSENMIQYLLYLLMEIKIDFL